MIHHPTGTQTATGRRGRLIPVQSTATSRRREGLARGRKPVPQGRPPFAALQKPAKTGSASLSDLQMKKFKPMKPHSLSANIQKNTAKVH